MKVELKFYSLIHSMVEKELPLIRLTTTIHGSLGNKYGDNSIVYRVSDLIGHGQPILWNDVDDLKSTLRSPCFESEHSSLVNPCFDEVPKDWMRKLIPVEVKISETKIDENSVEVFLYKVNPQYFYDEHKFITDHLSGNRKNRFLQYSDELPDASFGYWDDCVRHFVYSENLKDFPIILEHQDFAVYGNRNEFTDDKLTKIKMYLSLNKIDLD